MENFGRVTATKFKKQPHKLLSFASIIASSTLVTLKWEYIQGKIMQFRSPCYESEANLSKKFRPGNPPGVVIWERL